MHCLDFEPALSGSPSRPPAVRRRPAGSGVVMGALTVGGGADMSPDVLLHLQRLAGNGAVNHLLTAQRYSYLRSHAPNRMQARSAMNVPWDSLEREVDLTSELREHLDPSMLLDS